MLHRLTVNHTESSFEDIESIMQILVLPDDYLTIVVTKNNRFMFTYSFDDY